MEIIIYEKVAYIVEGVVFVCNASDPSSGIVRLLLTLFVILNDFLIVFQAFLVGIIT